MRKIKTINVDGREIFVKELTVLEIDRLFDDAAKVNSTRSILDDMLDQHDLTGDMLEFLSGVTVAELKEMTPSTYLPIVQAAKEVNPDFFIMTQMLKNRSERLERMFAAGSGGMFPPSLPPDTSTSGITD